MSVHIDPKQLIEAADIVAAPSAPADRHCKDRNFGLPTGLYMGFFGLFLAYLGVMAVGFAHPEMVLPMAIFVIFTVGFYVVPALWAGMKPDHADRPLKLDELLGGGIDTLTGRCSGGAAVAQVLILPILILLWGCAVVAIAAL